GTCASDIPLREDSPLNPSGMYAISKAAADMATIEYAQQHNMHAMTARPNNHIGPGQSPEFAIASFAQQLKKMAKSGTTNCIHAGNMESTRDFTDVRDVVSAYRLLLEKGQPCKAYNISSNNLQTIRTVFDELCNLANIRPEVVIDKERFRPTDSSPLLDIIRIQNDTGWKPQIPLAKTLKDILSEY
ncbi:MAG: GDP-mannose 4,6-dehydratase, partial [Kiritimatiellae bacterium]|nr:GDP-mannose 4,6-dehydratase [Kiritimatiellia bacterium]